MSDSDKAELSRLKAILAARQGQQGYQENCVILQAQIQKLESKLNG